MKSFIEVLGKNKETKAQEVALNHMMELQTEIASIEAALPSMKQQETMHQKKQVREATVAFESSLGNLKNPDTETIICKFVTLEAVENNFQNPFTTKVREATERLEVLKKVLTLFPANVEEIVVDDKE
jgi:hypothetical protein